MAGAGGKIARATPLPWRARRPGTGCGDGAAHAARRQRTCRRTPRRADGQQRSRTPQPGRRTRGAAGPGAHQPEHRRRDSSRTRRSSPASPQPRGAWRHGPPGRAARRRRRPRHRSRTCSRCSTWRGRARRAAHRDPWISRRPRLAAEVGGRLSSRQLQRELQAIGGRARDRDARRPLLRHGSRQAVGARRSSRIDAMVHGAGTPVTDPVAGIQRRVRARRDRRVHQATGRRGATARPSRSMRDGDAIFFFNYRSDRMRQIVARARASPASPAFPSPAGPKLVAATMTQYDQTFPLPTAFPPFSMARILAEVLSGAGRRQFRTAETEKYPHVTYFFNGGHRAAVAGRGARTGRLGRRWPRTTSSPE